jgi:hypothetical protein
MMNNMFQMFQTDEAKTRHVISLQQLTVAVSHRQMFIYRSSTSKMWNISELETTAFSLQNGIQTVCII